MSGNPQPDAIGHTQTCLQPESGAGCVHAQSADLSTGKRLAPGFGPIPPSGHAWRGLPLYTNRNTRRIWGSEGEFKTICDIGHAALAGAFGIATS